MSPLAQHLSAHPGPFRIPGGLGVGMSPCTDAHPLLVLPKQLKVPRWSCLVTSLEHRWASALEPAREQGPHHVC